MLFEEAPRAPGFLARLHELEHLTVETTARLLEQHPDVHAGRLNAQIVVTTIESLVHRLVTSQTPVDFPQLEDEIVILLTGYLRHPDDAWPLTGPSKDTA